MYCYVTNMCVLLHVLTFHNSLLHNCFDGFMAKNQTRCQLSGYKRTCGHARVRVKLFPFGSFTKSWIWSALTWKIKIFVGVGSLSTIKSGKLDYQRKVVVTYFLEFVKGLVTQETSSFSIEYNLVIYPHIRHILHTVIFVFPKGFITSPSFPQRKSQSYISHWWPQARKS